jgi:two-component system cell cycle sensor histidine kinase/response regulator CckA
MAQVAMGRGAGRKLRVLLVEDSLDDADLTVAELRRLGYALTHERVQDEANLQRALQSASWDLVLSDWSMPSFSALAALAVVRGSGLDVPFLIVSGTVGEDAAVEALHAGANDFLVKGKLTRLGVAIERELLEREVRESRRKTEEALQASELRFRRLRESGVVGITVTDSTSRIVEANEAFLKMVGYSRADLDAGSMSWAAMTPREWRHLNALAAERLDATGVAAPWEKEYLRKDGSRVPVLVAVARIDGSQSISISLDLSERKRLELQASQAQKMEAIGSLAGGVAHDFNNILSVILNYSEGITATLNPDDPMRADVEEIDKAARRAAALTRQLLAFSRRQVFERRVLDLNQCISGVERMLRRLLGAGIELTTLPASGPWHVSADPGQVEQVLMNLVVNARDAMPNGGKLVIETKNVEIDAEYARAHHDVAAGSYVMVAVSDTGIGMDKATLARLFEPFFTTKEPGKGTGLGLATVFGIVKQSGGHIWVYSEPGKGTTFKVYFPRVLAEASAAVEQHNGSDRPPPDSSRANETVLLVEDDDAVRVVARNILRRSGYVVLEAPNGGEALLISEQHGAKIHLLLTDVVLPRMSGRQLAERLATTRPEMKVLFMSGYTDDAILQHGVLDSGVSYLQKPLTSALLTQKVRDVLRGRGGG